MMMRFSELLRHHMNEREIGARRLGAEIGLSDSIIRSWLIERRLPQRENVLLVAKGLELGRDERAILLASAGYLAPGYVPVRAEVAAAAREVVE